MKDRKNARMLMSKIGYQPFVRRNLRSRVGIVCNKMQFLLFQLIIFREVI